MLAPNLMDALNADHLQFNDSASCKRWIESLPLTNVESSQRALTQQISLARQAVRAPHELLRMLEALREPVSYVQRELSRKYAGKPQPLDAAQAAWWAQVLRLWQEFIAAYALCRDAHLRGDSSVRNHGALIAMRCLRYTSSAMFEYYCIYRQAPGELWKQLHQHYADAEQGGFARTMVVDAFNHSEAGSSCATVYRQALLVQLASPFALSARQLEILARWSENWAGLVNLTSQPLPSSSTPTLAVDLAAGSEPAFAAGLEPRASLRYLDFETLGRTLRQTIALLKQSHTPAQLGLGVDVIQPDCCNLLMFLYIQWCRAGTGRGEQRALTAENVQVCFGMRAAHMHVSGRTERAPATRRSAAAESWQLVNQSSSGFLCVMRGPDAETRISHDQLVCVQRDSDPLSYLGRVRWLRVKDNNELLAGVHLFPGNARAVAVRPTGVDTSSGVNGYERGLLLPMQPVPSTPATLILPAGSYQHGRCLELRGGQKQVARLGGLLERGSDFERCTFTLGPSL